MIRKRAEVIREKLSDEERLARAFTDYTPSDSCNHRNQKGEYLFEINDDLTATCTKCGKTFTRRFAR